MPSTVGIVKFILVLPTEDELAEEFTHRNAFCVGFARAMMVREKEKELCALDDVKIVFELAMQCLQLDELGLQNDNETSQEKCAT